MKNIKVGDVKRLKTSSGYVDVQITNVKNVRGIDIVSWKAENGSCMGMSVASVFDEAQKTTTIVSQR